MTDSTALEPTYHRIPGTTIGQGEVVEIVPESFIPFKDEPERAFALHNELIHLGSEIHARFVRQVEILWELWENPRLVKCLGFDAYEEYAAQDEVRNAVNLYVGSKEQLYRLRYLATVHQKYPELKILDTPKLTALTQGKDTPLWKLMDLVKEDAPAEQAEQIWDEWQETRAEKRESHRDQANAETDTDLFLSDDALSIVTRQGRAVLILRRGWWKVPALVRAVSDLIHVGLPNRVIEDGQVVVWYEAKGKLRKELLGTVERKIKPSEFEQVRSRLRAKTIESI